MGSEEVVAKTKKEPIEQVEYEECGELNEYMGCKITRIEKSALKITQPVIIQSFTDTFDLPNHGCPTSARSDNVLTKSDESDLFSPKEQTTYRSGVGKRSHMMQYLALQIHNTVWDLVRHMFWSAPKHTKEILHCMKHCADRPTRGLVLASTKLWDGSNDYKFKNKWYF